MSSGRRSSSRNKSGTPTTTGAVCGGGGEGEESSIIGSSGKKKRVCYVNYLSIVLLFSASLYFFSPYFFYLPLCYFDTKAKPRTTANNTKIVEYRKIMYDALMRLSAVYAKHVVTQKKKIDPKNKTQVRDDFDKFSMITRILKVILS